MKTPREWVDKRLCQLRKMHALAEIRFREQPESTERYRKMIILGARIACYKDVRMYLDRYPL